VAKTRVGVFIVSSVPDKLSVFFLRNKRSVRFPNILDSLATRGDFNRNSTKS
jgi:hypothetical protein